MLKLFKKRERPALTERAQTVQVLLVEDDLDQVFLMTESLESARLHVGLHHVDDGEKCLKFLRKEAPYADACDVNLILLDLHMPRMDGFETMTEIVKDERLKHLPVVVLTTSKNPTDVQRMYDLRCSSFITKPVQFDDFTKAIRELTDYWLQVVVLPPGKQPAAGSS